MRRRRILGLIAAGAVVFVAAVSSGDGGSPADPGAAGLASIPSTSSTLPSTTVTADPTTTTEVATTTTLPPTTTTRAIPMPEVDRAELLFAPLVAGSSGDPAAAPPSGATQAMVVSITDGDTIRVRVGGAVEPLRLIGINSPEPGECFAAEAAAILEWLAPPGSTVWLTTDVSDRDRYDRLLRHVWVGRLNLGEELVRRGAALARDYPPDTSLSGRFHAAQEEAKRLGLGLWAKDACGPSAGYEVVITKVEADAPGNDHENLNGEFVVIRNQGAMGVDMTGWVLKDESASHRYRFPDGFTLAAGASVTVHTGCGNDTSSKLFWCSSKGAVWNNEGDTAFLLDHHGNLVHSLSWVPPTTTTTRPRTTTTTKPKQGGSGGSGGGNCHPSYPTVCIPPPPPDLDCGDIPYRRFKVLPPDPHRFDRDKDGIGCES
jgi:micrococcal nuclease